MLYNSYFYDAHDPETSVLDKLRLHGRELTSTLDGGVGCHINLDSHLTAKQYEGLIEFAVKEGTSYFTFNVPNSKCNDCGHIVKANVDRCPKCGFTSITHYTRVIGYLRPVTSFSKPRAIEESQRVYQNL